MTQKLSNINCVCYKEGFCTHQAAPRRWFGSTGCTLTEHFNDPRRKQGCNLKIQRSSALQKHNLQDNSK